ncbi:vacuolar protein sorting-associated protein 13-like [Anopheles albimanus]|uniref:vacuolar protein sorting-associated protein 13-like n=1 Tax=Anopheles albimanus TaxID=7167 RepID=UPI001640F221|nr:vacuolar protein sorting-associated protein 13-like [Anopheles albimanus]
MAGSESKALPGILSTILQGVGVTLTDINDVVFRLAFFEHVIGNPYGLVVGFTRSGRFILRTVSGSHSGSGEFAEGLVLGVRSLFGHTVGGAAGAVSKITGAMGKGLAALTFDDDFQRKRRDALNKSHRRFRKGLREVGRDW